MTDKPASPQKMLQWFKVGKPIPANATYIKSKIEKENIKEHWDHDLLPPCISWDEIEYHLYEVPL
jgi:hypothetical protein